MTMNRYIELLTEIKKKNSILTDRQRAYLLDKIIAFQEAEVAHALKYPQTLTDEERKQILERIEFTLMCIDHTIDLAIRSK